MIQFIKGGSPLLVKKEENFMNNKFEKKGVALLVAMFLMIFVLVACGGDDTDGTEDNIATTDEATEDSGAAGEEIVLYFAHWNDQIQQRFYEVVELPENVRVEWVWHPNENNVYQEELMRLLPAGEIDLFVLEADHMMNFINEPYVLDIADAGITNDEIAYMYEYTLEIATSNDGAIRALAWEANPGLFVYRRSFAEEVLGVSEPEDVQPLLDNWDAFRDVAEQMNAAGYHMLSGFDDAYRVFSNNVAAPWVNENDEIIIDDNIWNWVDQTADFTANGFNNMGALWSDEWTLGKGSEGTVFGYFHAPWGINFVHRDRAMDDPDGPHEVGNGTFGDWAAVRGPEPFFWGGTWIVGYANTEHPELVGEIMRQMTIDQDNLETITNVFQDFVNNRAVAERIANSDFESAFLGGQNHIALLLDAADEISMAHVGPYDQTMTESFQDAFGDYFESIAAGGDFTREQALNNFFTTVTTLHPWLVRPE